MSKSQNETENRHLNGSFDYSSSFRFWYVCLSFFPDCTSPPKNELYDVCRRRREITCVFADRSWPPGAWEKVNVFVTPKTAHAGPVSNVCFNKFKGSNVNIKVGEGGVPRKQELQAKEEKLKESQQNHKKKYRNKKTSIYLAGLHQINKLK